MPSLLNPVPSGHAAVANLDRNYGSQAVARLLIIDDEPSLCQLLEIAFRKEGYKVETTTSGKSAIQKIDSQAHDLIISDIRMPDISGIDLLKHARQYHSSAGFILITAVPAVETAIQALNLGANRYVVKTHSLVEELKLVVARTLEELALREENVRLRREMLRLFAANNIVGQSRKIQVILEVVRTIAATTSTVLITGESGTGKELVARAIHEASDRRDKPFVSINCGAFPETLLESELFGYLKGAFTGADANKKGIIEAANGGTLFLDEIGETSPAMQVKLLRVLQERTVRPLGGTLNVPVDIRLIASTNRDLQAMVGAGQFREDFYYRVSVIPVRVPPLRERPEDIAPLAQHFVQKFSLQMGKSVRQIDERALAALSRYAWPGNVRELENVIERAVAITDPAETSIRLSQLPDYVGGVAAAESERIHIPKEGVDLELQIALVEKRYLQEALRIAGGVRSRAAELLHLSYRSFRHYAGKHGV
jgi:two-component system, NtrC family, response regulator PilR